MNALVKSVSFHDLRLPYNSALEDLGIDNIGWKVLIDTVFPGAKSADSIVMAATYCRHRNLDIFKRPVHIVPMWSSIKKDTVETIWPGIAELRTTAFRTGQYAGNDEAEFGPVVEDWKFEDTWVPSARNIRAEPETRTEIVTFHEWCRLTIYRILHGQRYAFVGPKVYWEEAYGSWKGTTVPNEMWCRRPIGQHEKCAEAAALRRAFPEEIGNELVAEEMEGRTLEQSDQLGYDIPNAREADTRRPPPPVRQIEVSTTPVFNTLGDDGEAQEAALVEAGIVDERTRRAPQRANVGPEHGGTLDRDAPRDTRRPPPPRNVEPNPRSAPPPPAELEHPSEETTPLSADKEAAIINKLEMRAAEARDDDDLANVWEELMGLTYPRMSQGGRSRADVIYRNRQAKLRGG